MTVFWVSETKASRADFQGSEPEAVVGEFGVALLDGGLEAQDVLGEGQGLKFLVGLDDGEGGRDLVDLAALYADEAVFDHVHPSHAVRARR